MPVISRVSDCPLWGILHMSNGINQNATCYKTASAQEERLLYPCAQGCAVPRAAHPPQLWFPGLPGTPWSQAKTSASRALSGAGTGSPAPDSCAGLGGCVGGGPRCALPQPPALLWGPGMGRLLRGP